MNTLSKSMIVISFSLASAGSIIAQSNQDSKRMPPPDGKKPIFEALLEKMDANKDALISVDEVEGPLKDHFEMLDANKDGFLDKEEFDKAAPPKKNNQPK